MSSLRRAVNLLIYLSVMFGLLLLLQLYAVAPIWLFYSILGGWLIYLLVAVAAATGHKVAYPAACLLSIITLLISLPQPEHYSLVRGGFSLASITFVIGSALQVALLILIPVFLLRKRKE